jgi:solute:Na+ symporter, SSS family
VGRAFVPNGESPAASAGGVSIRVAPEGDGAGSGDDNYTWPGIEGSFESDFHVADHFDWCSKDLSKKVVRRRRHIGVSGPGSAQASARNICDSDAGCRAGLPHGFEERCPRLGPTYPHDVAGAGCSCGQELGIIAYRARRLRAAAVDAKVIGHGLVLTQSSSRFPLSAIGGLEARTKDSHSSEKRGTQIMDKRRRDHLSAAWDELRLATKMGLNKLDYAIIAFYLAGVTLFGLRFRKKQRSLRDYFLAGRDIPWWAIALSIVAAETSTLTIISIPGLAYDTNFTFLEVVMGYVVGRVVISFVLLPDYFRGELYTAYELIERRFGQGLRSLTAGLFLLTRAAAEGVRVYAVSIVVSIALGTGQVASIAIITALTLIYTFEGGLAAVIWTDVVQTAIYVGGTLVGLATIVHLVPGGWNAIHAAAAGAGKLQVFDFRVSPWIPYTFWAGVIGGAFFTTASHGTDQLIVQRLLAARGERQSVTALLASGIAILFQFALFLLVGTMLWAYYRLPSSDFGRADRIYPTFIVTRMPHGISGLLIAAILAAAMSNLSAALNSLSSSAVLDFYMRLRPQADEETKMRLSRLATLAWALVLFGLAIIALHRVGRVVEAGLQIASVAYGALLGAFLLGVLTRRANQYGAMIGMLGGFCVELYLWLGTHLPWTWWVMIGTATTFAIGYLASFASQAGGLSQ